MVSDDVLSAEVTADVSLEEEAPSALGINYPQITSDMFEENLRAKTLPGKPEGVNNESWMAFQTAQMLHKKNPDLFGDTKNAYRALRMGEADFLPEEMKGQQISDRDIMRFFLRNPDNEPMREGSFTRGFGKQIAPSAGGFAGGVAGVKAGFALQQLIPPAGIPVIAAKALIPLIGGITGAILGEEGVQKAKDFIVGEEELIYPGEGAGMERVGETAAIGLSFAPTPFLLPKTFSVGGAKYLENLADERARNIIKFDVGPLPKEVGAETMAAALKKDPMLARLTSGYERLISQAGTDAATRPIRTGIAEGSFVLGATGGRYVAEETFDGEYALPAEIIGGIAAGLTVPSLSGGVYTLATNAGSIYRGLGKLRQDIKEKGFRNVFSPPASERSLNEVANLLDDRLRQAGEDPAQVAEVLTQLVNDPNFKEFTSGTLSQSPTLLRIEHNLGALFPSLAEKGRGGVLSALDTYAQMIAAFAKTGDSEALRTIEQSFQATLEDALTKRLQQQADRVVQASQKVGTEESQTGLGLALRENLEKALQASRAKERTLYSEIPEVEIGVFRGFPESADELGEVREIPNIFDFVDSLPVSRASLQELPKEVKAQVNFLKEVLQDAGIDTSRLGRRSAEVGGEEAVESASAPVQRRIDTLDRQRQKIFDGMPTFSRDFMNRNIGLSEEAMTGDVETRLESVRNAINRVDSLITAQRVDKSEAIPTIPELRDIRKYYQNRMARLRAENDLQNIAADVAPITRTEAERSADEIIDLAALVDDLRSTGEPLTISSRKLTEARTQALGASRALGARGERNAARLSNIFERLANQDLTGSIDEIAGEGTKSALTAARAYSRALNNVFTRSSASNALDEVRSGADRIPPEELIRKLFGGPPDTALKAARDVREVGQFLTSEIAPMADDLEVGDVGQLVNDIDDVSDRAIRNLRATALNTRNVNDPEAIKINQEALKTWLANENNQAILDVLPRGALLRQDLQDADAAYQALMTAKNQAAASQKKAQSRLLFKRIVAAGDETPSETIRQAIGSKKPMFQLNQIFNTISRVEGVSQEAKNEARTVLQEGIIDWAMDLATNKSTGSLSPKKMYDALFTPKMLETSSSLTPADWLASKDLVPEAQLNQIKQLLSEMRNVEGLLDSKAMDELMKETNPMKDLALRIIGAKIGTSASSAIGGSEASLIAASAGSRALRSLFMSKSGINNMKAFKALMEDPKMLAELLKKPRTERETRAVGKKIRDWLMGKGFVFGRRTAVAGQGETDEPEFEQERATEVERAPRRMTPPTGEQPPAQMPRPTAQAPRPTAPMQLPPLPQPQAPATSAAPNPQARQQYAAMFPYEGVSQMIKGGIGSLS